MSVVYMIKCLDETVPEIYIGSTCNYKRRQSEHKSSCNNPNSTNHNLKLYRFIRSKGGFDNFTFEIIEECSNEDKIELESIYYDLFNPELNTYKFDFDAKEYRENNKENILAYKKKYNNKNKEKVKEYHKEYTEKNKEKILAYRKEYREKNKEKKIAYHKEYHKERICCRACRCEIRKAEFKRHCRSKKHIANQTNK